MRRLLLRFAFVLLMFAIGVGTGAVWQAKRSHSQNNSTVAQRVQEEEESPLTKEIVSRSLQTDVFRTEQLRRNSNHEIVWRWLKESIATYPQNWITLNISDEESYQVVLYPQRALDSSALTYYNKELSERGMPLLREHKRYLPIEVYQGNIVCPNWSGFVDAEEARLVYFAGASG